MKVKIGKVLEWLLFLNVLLLIILFGYTRNFDVQVLGYQGLVVKSDSMAPEIPVGSIVITKKIPPSDLQVGDVVSFLTETKQRVTHRIVQIDQDQKIQTKGDNNSQVDYRKISGNQITGNVIFVVPYIGKLVFFLRSKKGIIVIVSCVLLFLLLSRFLKVYKHTEGDYNGIFKEKKS